MINNYRNYFSKCAAAGLCLSMLSLTSCGVIEMRDAAEEVTRGEADTTMMLAPAERANNVEIRTEEQHQFEIIKKEEAPKTVVSLAATGDVRIDEAIIADAANRAAEGSTYSFLKIYSGVYRTIHDADIAVGNYSAAAAPYTPDGSTDRNQTTPIESLAALAELGFEVLDTTGADRSADYPQDMSEYGIADIHSEKRTEDGVYFVEREGITIAFLAADGSVKNKMVSNIEYADSAADVVVVSADWKSGTSDKQKKNLAGTMAKAGADIILGSGETLGGAEWLDTGDGSPALAVYSLGNFVATAETAENLCGGILSLDITLCEGEITLENVCIDPIIMHYNEGNRNYQIFGLNSYTDDISAMHAVGGLDVAVLTDKVSNLLNGGFLPADFLN
ncbi:MAG: CapA family protein [Clostridia bacterium]|nr:CapA family protein [Clostridia bacterium]MBQ9997033.1 CapA family protein [Clostridia bacterium]